MTLQNILEIKILAESLLNGDVRRKIQLIIDGRDLIERLREYEMPFATREEAPQIAGAYSGLDPKWTNPEHFEGIVIRCTRAGRTTEESRFWSANVGMPDAGLLLDGSR